MPVLGIGYVVEILHEFHPDAGSQKGEPLTVANRRVSSWGWSEELLAEETVCVSHCMSLVTEDPVTAAIESCVSGNQVVHLAEVGPSWKYIGTLNTIWQDYAQESKMDIKKLNLIS